MRSIAVINQKGGVGKTTSSVNLAAALSEAGRKVCLLDLDPQAHASLHQPHFLALHGLSKLLRTIEVVSCRLNSGLRLSGVMLCMYDSNTRLAAEVSTDIDEFFQASRGGRAFFGQAKFFDTRIRRNIRLAEAPSFGQSIFQYAPQSNGSTDYQALADEVLAQEACGESTTQLAAA